MNTGHTKSCHEQAPKAEEENKPFIKDQRFNLFMNPENLTPKRESSLKELLSMNKDLKQAYVLKDMLK